MGTKVLEILRDEYPEV